jgi:hypothetical protein
VAAGILVEHREFNFRELPRDPRCTPIPSLLGIECSRERLAAYHKLIDEEKWRRESVLERAKMSNELGVGRYISESASSYQAFIDRWVDAIIEYENSPEHQKDLKIQRIDRIRDSLGDKSDVLHRAELMRCLEIAHRERTLPQHDGAWSTGSVTLAIADELTSGIERLEAELRELEADVGVCSN